jgi:predicted nucleic acid-binding protein
MITAVDTNVLLDILAGDETHAESSTRALLDARREGALVAGDVVWAEVSAWFPDPASQRSAMADLGVDYDAPSELAAALGGRIWRSYRSEGGSRARLVPDFLVGAHALTQADRLLTRDRGFFRRYFNDLVIVDPSIELLA